jgi:RNA polymerase sigma factor (sigma-70 family)
MEASKGQMTGDPEYVLIDRILSGESSLYAELVNRYKSYVFTIAAKILPVRAEAEEAAQDAFIKAFNGLKGFHRDSKFSTWLYRIAFNTAVSYKRKQKFSVISIETSLPGHSHEQDNVLERSDKKKYLHLAMLKLNESDRTALTLFYLDEFSLEEIAIITGTQANTIKVRIHRARLRMAEELKNILNEEALTL